MYIRFPLNPPPKKKKNPSCIISRLKHIATKFQLIRKGEKNDDYLTNAYRNVSADLTDCWQLIKLETDCRGRQKKQWDFITSWLLCCWLVTTIDAFFHLFHLNSLPTSWRGYLVELISGTYVTMWRENFLIKVNMRSTFFDYLYLYAYCAFRPWYLHLK